MESRFFTPEFEFQSTLPVGEATWPVDPAKTHDSYFNPRFPWGKRPLAKQSVKAAQKISIHASRGGSDHCRCRFLPWPQHFNPRFPWGKRQKCPRSRPPRKRFQSTLPVGEATAAIFRENGTMKISIHASRGGSDRRYRHLRHAVFDFNPRFPWGKRPEIAL